MKVDRRLELQGKVLVLEARKREAADAANFSVAASIKQEQVHRHFKFPLTAAFNRVRSCTVFNFNS